MGEEAGHVIMQSSLYRGHVTMCMLECVCVGGCKMTGVPYSLADVLLPHLRLHFVRKWAGEETRSVTQVRMVSTNTLCSAAL